MRQLPQETAPFVDREGYPQGAAVKTGGGGRDEENGELLTSKVICLRKQPKLRVSPRMQSFLSPSIATHGSHGDVVRRFTGFRIPQHTQSNNNGKARSGRPRSLVGPKLQPCVYLKGGAPIHCTMMPVDTLRSSLGPLRRDDYALSPGFRVPKESLPKSPTEQNFRNSKTFCVNIWEEFLFGKSVIPNRREARRVRRDQRVREEVEEEGFIKFFKRVLGSFLPKFAIDLLVYTVYFLMFFFSCVGYNMYCELGCYILFAQHLKIHEKAYEEKLDVTFTGSVFQGPLYAITRNYCEHCCQRDRAKVMMRLMKKMKIDILPSETTSTNSSAKADEPHVKR